MWGGREWLAIIRDVLLRFKRKIIIHICIMYSPFSPLPNFGYDFLVISYISLRPLLLRQFTEMAFRIFFLFGINYYSLPFWNLLPSVFCFFVFTFFILYDKILYSCIWNLCINYYPLVKNISHKLLNKILNFLFNNIF